MAYLIRASALVFMSIIFSGCGEKPPPKNVAQAQGKWTHFKERDQVTDVERLSAVLRSDAGGAPAELHVRCAQGKLEVYVSWNRYIGQVHEVDARIDSDQHEPNKWSASTDGKSSFYPFVSRKYLDRIGASSRYLVRVKTFSGEEVTAEFDTSKFGDEAGSIISQCLK